MAGTLKVGGNIIATHTGVEGAGEVSLTNVSLGGGAFMFRNKIINGDMRISQRGDVTLTTDDQSTYTGVDRFKINGNPPSARGTIKRTADAPEGLAYCLELDVTQNGTPTSTYFGNITQIIEGQNLSDLNWGTANAKSVTLSFWVKTNISGGTNGFTISLSTDTANDRSIHKTYTVSQADTWEKKTITFPGDTSAAIPNTNTIGLQVSWCHSAFSDRQTSTADVWKAGNRGYALQNAAPNFWSSTDNYFKITGVQLEIGTAATPFEHRPIGVEKSLCYRYYYRMTANPVNVSGTTNASYIGFAVGRAYSTSAGTAIIFLPEPLRTSPPVFNYSPITGNNWDYVISDMSLVNRQLVDTRTIAIYASISVAQSQSSWLLSTGNIGSGSSSTDSVFMDFSAEL